MWLQIASILCLLAASCNGKAVGMDNGMAQKRVYRGKEPEPNKLSYQVAIVTSDNRIVCGGSLVSNRMVVTAAHCLVTKDGILKPLGTLKVLAGVHSIAKIEGREQQRAIKQVVVHEDYDPGTFINDIAILEVQTPFQLNTFVQPITLAKSGTVYEKLNCSVSGWGATEYSSGYTVDTIRVGYLDIMDKIQCAERHRELKLLATQAAHFSSICAGHSAGGVDSCKGDSGGPLVCKTSSEKDVLVGIVSTGVGCGEKNSPGLYTDVAKMETWLTTSSKQF